MLDRADASAPHRLASRLLGTGAGRAALLAVVSLPVLAVDGVRTVDADLPGLLAGLGRGAAVPAERGFLLEGVLPDAVGAGLARLGMAPAVLPLAWWGLGLALLAAVAALGLRRGEIRFSHLLLLAAFSHVADTLALWVGKFDPWLMAFLLLSAWWGRGASVAGAVLAAFCHPILAVLSTGGVVAVERALAGRLRLLQGAGVLVAAGADLALVHGLMPAVVGRASYAAGLATGILHDAALMAPPTLLSGGLVPFALVRHFAGPFRYGGRCGAALLGAWAAGALLVGCVLTLDHTRVLCLLTLAPAVAFLRLQPPGAGPERWDWGLFALLLLCRFALPHIDGDGAVASTPYPLAPWVDPAPARSVLPTAAGSARAPPPFWTDGGQVGGWTRPTRCRIAASTTMAASQWRPSAAAAAGDSPRDSCVTTSVGTTNPIQITTALPTAITHGPAWVGARMSAPARIDVSQNSATTAAATRAGEEPPPRTAR